MPLNAFAIRVSARNKARDPARHVRQAAVNWRTRDEANLKAEGVVIPLSEWLGHNNGPPLNQNFFYLNWVWTKAQKTAFTPPTPEIGIRWAKKAAELGVSYRTYVLEILEHGRHLQAEDKDQ